MFEGKTFLDILQLGGLIMYVLLLCSLISITIFLERLFYYRKSARKRGEEGDVLLKIEVLVNGRVGQVEVAESSGFTLLDEAALRTVRRCVSSPRSKDEKRSPAG